ncbi:MAG: glycosylasparaginase [Bacteroidetes bacterium]|nr:MAG: glycosylasparaginase [Bacteroidota bacterium]
MERRQFLQAMGLAALPVPAATVLGNNLESENSGPVVVSTWSPNIKANAAAWKVLMAHGSALDAVHAGVMVPEADPKDQSVGYGGLPDRDGKVTLDSCIMDHKGNIGAVMALEGIMHASSVARLVMEKTPHVQIVGAGALQLALEHGFKVENLLTESSKKAWEEWKKTSKYSPMTTVENLLKYIENQHDTIGMLARDEAGNLSGACSTSGMGYKMRGRVGDSPIIGAGLFVDNEVGAASATGVGEEVVRIVGSHTIVEMMRQGKNPEDACKEAVARLVKLKGETAAKALQVGFIALNAQGQYGCFSLNPNFTMAVHSHQGVKVIQAKSWFPKK